MTANDKYHVIVYPQLCVHVHATLMWLHVQTFMSVFVCVQAYKIIQLGQAKLIHSLLSPPASN